MQSEVKENVQGTNSKGKETRTQISNLEQKEEMNIQLEHNEELPQYGKGNRLPGSPGSSESQRSWTQGSTYQGTS